VELIHGLVRDVCEERKRERETINPSVRLTNDRGRVSPIANLRERTPIIVPVSAYRLSGVVRKNVTMSASPARPRRRTWVNVYRRGSFMVHHTPCKVALYTLPLPIFLSLHFFVFLSLSPCSLHDIATRGWLQVLLERYTAHRV